MQKNIENVGEQASKNTNSRPCFIITPIGELNSPVNLKAKGLINSVIEPILREFDFEALPAYKMADSGSINRQVLKSIISNELVIANLTGLNPNVMYELAVRHAVRLPVIIMAEENTKLPFDINDQRTIFYSDTLFGSEICKPLLRSAIQAILNLAEKNEQVDNPIYQVYEEISIIKTTKNKDQTIDEYLLKRFDRLENAILRISNDSERYNTLVSNTKFRNLALRVENLTGLSDEKGVNELIKLLKSRVFSIEIEVEKKSVYKLIISTQASNGYLSDIVNASGMFKMLEITLLSISQ